MASTRHLACALARSILKSSTSARGRNLFWPRGVISVLPSNSPAYRFSSSCSKRTGPSTNPPCRKSHCVPVPPRAPARWLEYEGTGTFYRASGMLQCSCTEDPAARDHCPVDLVPRRSLQRVPDPGHFAHRPASLDTCTARRRYFCGACRRRKDGQRRSRPNAGGPHPGAPASTPRAIRTCAPSPADGIGNLRRSRSETRVSPTMEQREQGVPLPTASMADAASGVGTLQLARLREPQVEGTGASTPTR